MKFTVAIKPVVAGALMLTLAACADMNDTQQRTLSGAAIGTGAGVVGAAATGGCVSCGAAIGAAAGAAGGYIYDRSQKNKGH